MNCQENESANYFSNGGDIMMNLLDEQSSSVDPFSPNEQTPSDEQYQNSQLQLPQCQSSQDYKDIFDKDQNNSLLPQNPFVEFAQEPTEIMNSASRGFENEVSMLGKKEYKIDKIAYQEQTRALKINRYKSKKCKRVWDRKISYSCRKIVADKRIREHGRFVKKAPQAVLNELSEHKNSIQTVDLLIIQAIVQDRQNSIFQDFIAY